MCVRLLIIFVAQELVTAQLNSASELTCDFDEFESCAWRNGTDGVDDDFDWGRADRVTLDGWHSIPRSKDGDGDFFLYVRGTNDKDREDVAMLISPVIGCLQEDGILSLWFWKTAHTPALMICIRQPPGPEGEIDCIETIHGAHRQEWVFSETIVPEQEQPFELVIQAGFRLHTDIVGIDEVMFEGNICGGGGTFTTSSTRTTNGGGGGGGPGGLCPKTDCGFDSGNLCQYFNTGSGSWQTSNAPVANALTGIQTDRSGNGHFAFAGGSTSLKDDVFVLESPRFTSDFATTLSYSYYQAGIEGMFRVCVNEESNCPLELLGKDLKIGARRWMSGSVDIPSGTNKVLFIAERLAKNYVVGLDDIRLNDRSGNNVECF